MTGKEASIIVGNIPINGDEGYSIPEYQQAKAIAIKALELTGLLKGRPCEVCANKNNGFGCVWDCPFDSVVVPKTEYEYAIFDETGFIRSQPMDSLDDAQELLKKFKDYVYEDKKFHIRKRPIVTWEIYDDE